MAKVGLKETLSLLAAGYKKKDIEALAAIDEEQDQKEEQPSPDPEPEKKEEEPEPDYKTMYEELLKKNQETENKINKIQQDNIHKDSAPAAAEAKAKEAESLANLVRGFM